MTGVGLCPTELHDFSRGRNQIAEVAYGVDEGVVSASSLASDRESERTTVAEELA